MVVPVDWIVFVFLGLCRGECLSLGVRVCFLACVCRSLCVFVCFPQPAVCSVCSLPDLDECAVCSPPQGVAQIMIQSFQLSSCALFNAQMQDVSCHPLSVSTGLLLTCVCLRQSVNLIEIETAHTSIVVSMYCSVVTVLLHWYFFFCLISLLPRTVTVGVSCMLRPHL